MWTNPDQVLVSRTEFDALKNRVETFNAHIEDERAFIRAGLNEAQSNVKKAADAAGVHVDTKFKIRHAKPFRETPKKAIAPAREFRSAQHKQDFDMLVAMYTSANISQTRAEEEAWEELEADADNTYGPKGGSTLDTATKEYARLKSIEAERKIPKDLKAHAASLGLDVKGAQVWKVVFDTYQNNEKTYGFGFNEWVKNPFEDPTPETVQQFEDWKKSVGLPAGQWLGTAPGAP